MSTFGGRAAAQTWAASQLSMPSSSWENGSLADSWLTPFSGWIAGCVPTFGEWRGLFAIREVRVISTDGSRNNPDLQWGRFVSVSPCSFLQGYLQGRYKTFLTYHKTMMTKPSVTPPSWKHTGKARDTILPREAPHITTAPPAFSPLHRTPPTPCAFCGTKDKAATKHMGLFMAHGSIKLLPSAIPEEPISMHFKQRGSAPSAPVCGISGWGGPVRDLIWGKGAWLPASPAISHPPPHLPTTYRAGWVLTEMGGEGTHTPGQQGWKGETRTESTGSSHENANGATATSAPSHPPLSSHSYLPSPHSPVHQEGKGFLL